MFYKGEYPINHTAVTIPFDSFAASTGAPSAVTNFAAGDVQIYKDGSATQRTSSNGITVTTSFDSTGLQMIVIDLSDNSDSGFYAAGHEYDVAVADITIDGQTVRFWAGSFSIERAGGVLELLKAGTAQVDVKKISGDSTAADNLESYTDGTTPMPVNATQLSGDATAADNAEAFFDGTGYAGTNNTIPTVTTLTNAPSDSAGVTSLLARIPSGLFTGITSLAQWLGLLAGKQTGNSTARTEIRATGGGSGTFDETTDSQEALRDRGDAAWTTATGFSTLDAAGVRSAVGLASANLDTQLGDLPTNAELATALGTADDAVLAAVAVVDANVDAIKAVTDELSDTLEDDGGTFRFTANALEEAPTDGAAPTASDIADEVETRELMLTAAYDPAKTAAQAGDAMALTSGERTTLTAAIWAALTSGLSTVGSIGKLLVDNVNATISSRSSHAAADVWAVGTRTLTSFGTLASDVWAVATRVLTAGTNIVLAKGTGITGFNDLSAAQVNAEADTALADVGVTTTVTGRIDVAVSTRLATSGYTAPLDAAGTRTAIGLATANLDTQLDALPTNAELATSQAAADDATLAAIAALNDLSAAEMRAALGMASADLDTQLLGIATSAAAAEASSANAETNSAAIKTQTDKLTFDGDNALDANVQKVHDVQLTGTGVLGDGWGPA